ncbi:MAG TPA: metallophosphoesterase [Opitutales bacterium]|nr:metallophosphoesterase [Opitutales bacterium]
MSELTGLGMTDVASRPRHWRVWLLGGCSLLLVLTVVLLRNYLFVKAGMLEPDFSLIHDAYDFNLWQLPIGLLVIALVFFGLATTWTGFRKPLYCFCGIYLFLAVDLLALRYYVTYVEPERLVLRKVRLETPKLAQTVRILHISDIQAGSIGDYEKEIFARIAALEPDLILNTGDYLQEVPPATFESELPKLIELFRTLDPEYGIYGVFGDTEMELYGVPEESLEPLDILSSETVEIDTGGGVISIHGLSLYQSNKPEWARRTVEQWLEDSGGPEFRILMGHAPDYAMGMAEQPIDLCLAGHTHGGQVRLPFIGPLTTYSKVPKDWARGFRRIGIPYLNVSAGAGSNRRHGLPPIRFNCPTEMTLIELVPLRSIR